MIKFISKPTVIESAGNKIKIIEEFFGMVNSKSCAVSIAKMTSPEGWEEPGQTPDFDEYTMVLKGALQVKTKTDIYTVLAGEAILIEKNEWVQYASPYDGGAEYIAVCLPAFSPDTVHRDK